MAGNLVTTLPTPRWRYGLEFIGWFTEPEGGTQVSDIRSWQCDGKHFYAHWKQLDTINEDIILAGGESDNIGVSSENLGQEMASKIDFSKVTFRYTNNKDVLKIYAPSENGVSATVCVKARRKGTVVIESIYEGKVIKRSHVIVTSDWADYIAFCNWRKGVEQKIWTSSMSVEEKIGRAQKYIMWKFDYYSGGDGSCTNAIYAWQDMKADCVGAAGTLAYFVQDIGVPVKYVRQSNGQMYDELSEAIDFRHIYNAVYLDGEWYDVDSTPLHSYEKESLINEGRMPDWIKNLQ